MKVTSEKIEGCQVALTIEVEPDEMTKALDGAYRRLANKVVVPGFRKGKAPRGMLERQIGKEALDAEALDHLVPELYDRAVQQEAIDVIGQPDMKMVQLEPPIFKATVPVRPVVELGDYHSVRVTPEKVEIKEEEINEAIENLRRMQGTWEPAEREACLNDMVTADIVGKVEDNAIIDVKGTQYKIMADAPIPVAGFPEQLVGMKAGESKEFTLRFPDDHKAPEIAGKDCQFSVSMTAVKEQRLPEVNDEFVKSIGQGLDTVEQLKERIRDNMRVTVERDARDKLESQIVEEIVKISKIEFPAVLTEHEINHLIEEQLRSMGGMKIEDFLRMRGISGEELSNQLRPAGEKRVLGSLVLNKVFEAENIQVTDADIDGEIERVLQDAGEHTERVREIFKSPMARDSIRNRLLTQKTLDRLVEIATASESGPASTDTAPAEG